LALHALRLFRSRTQAAAAIECGEVLLDGERVKPSRELRPGGRLTLRGPHGERQLEVLDIPRRGLTREAARALVRQIGPAPDAPGPKPSAEASDR
jgi:ribosome-associated heat shock protein Hsp15